MKREINVPGKTLLVFYRIIVVIMLLLVVLLITGSLYALIRSRDSGPRFRIGGRGGQGETVGKQAVRDGSAIRDGDGAYSVFTGIGTLRIQTSAKVQAAPQTVIVLTISFPYKSEDRLFTEELASHIKEFRAIATSYFANLPQDNLAKLDEDKAKAEILARYNALLHLGKIDTLYFGDLMIMD
jgi:flagellar basal body-associated protein FliL